MRGAPVLEIGFSQPIGIIPAYAGSTLRGDWRQGIYEDHPRVCGEHLSGMLMASGRMGSSPRMRGARDVCYRCWR